MTGCGGTTAGWAERVTACGEKISRWIKRKT